jgi:hypothetical protein
MSFLLLMDTDDLSLSLIPSVVVFIFWKFLTYGAYSKILSFPKDPRERCVVGWVRQIWSGIPRGTSNRRQIGQGSFMRFLPAAGHWCLCRIRPVSNWKVFPHTHVYSCVFLKRKKIIF